MSYAIFLDDERLPGRDMGFSNVVIVRSVADAKEVMTRRGAPQFISFDHDLGKGKPTGYDFAKWLVEQHLDGAIDLSGLSFYVHSQNPVGAENIRMLLGQFIESITNPS